ncbi:MAG: lipopolysaccharide biosynthesis protein [Rhizobiales bacterium]|nr:lipopolysaccharide biosynthesis protein [Hyphomicrobiales bacterium]
MVFSKKSKAAPPPAPVVAPVVMAGEPDMRGLGRALWRNKKMILGLTLLSAAAAFLVVNMITPRYRSESRLLLEVRENVFMRAEADKSGGALATIDPEAVTSQIQVVLSRDLAREVIKKENLAANPEFDPTVSGTSLLRTLLGLIGIGRDPSTMSQDERTLEAYYDRLNVFAIEKSRVISVDFSSADPEVAARVANAVAENYLAMQQSAKQDQTRAAGNWLAVEIEKMRKKVEEAEAKVEEYRVKSNLFVGSNNSSLPNQQLTEINSQISAARGQKADLEARARQLRDQVRSGKPVESSDIANSDSMRRLVEQRVALRSQLAEQSSTLLDQHPRIKELKAQIGELDRQIKVEGERLARQLDNDAAVAGNRVESLTASLDQVKKLASQSNEQDVQLRAFEREAKTQRDLLESYLVKYREASARDNINAAPPEARIISRATPAIKPAYPKKLPTVLIVAFAAFALSAGFTVTGVLLGPAPSSSYAYGYASAGYDAPAYEPPAMPATAPVPPRVASPPLAPAAGFDGGVAVMSLPVSTVEQIARNLRAAGDAGRRVTVVGTMRNVGTTYAAITLARALAKDANVVLVDLAFGAPNLSIISTDPKAPGIAELVQGTASFGDIITRDQYSNVHLVATGNVGNDGATLAASPMLATVIEALVRSYDHVVLDVGSAADVAVERFAPLATRAVLVAADPPHPATRAARERLMMAGFADVTLLAGSAQSAAA